MDHDRFDALARSLAGGLSRRRALQGLAGGALGGLLGLAGLREAAAACRLVRQACDAGRRCCLGARCANGRCRCKEDQNFFACNGPGTRCINIATSERHCGGCGTDGSQCDPAQNEICRNGGCVDACEDGLRDGEETDVDCGGPLCPPCARGQKCVVDNDCEGDLRCDIDTFTCQDPDTCDDGIKNGRETDVDCGGAGCQACADGLRCFVNDDCQNRFCDRPEDAAGAGVCGTKPSCRNGRKDGTESDVDCGGPNCPLCEFGQKCASAADCAAGNFFCLDRAGDGSAQKVCAECKIDDHCLAIHGEARPVCVRNRCQECRRDADCPAGELCDGNECGGDRCANGVEDGDETDVDCGGSICLPCGVGQGCGDNSDCFSSASCVDNVCRDGTRGACPEGGDGCDGDGGGCNFDLRCTCRLRVTSASEPAASFCAHSFFDTVCFSCATDGDCVAVTGPGSACVNAHGPFCNCVVEGGRACAPPCPSAA